MMILIKKILGFSIIFFWFGVYIQTTVAAPSQNSKQNPATNSRANQSQSSTTKKVDEKVCSENSPNSALIVIDMQPYFANRGGQHNTPENKAKIEKIIEMQIGSIKKAIEANVPIVFLEYECGPCDPTDSKLKSAVVNYKKARFIKKNTDGMFENYNTFRTELVDFLKKNDVGTLVITGANGGACVRRSIFGALENNCNVVAFSEGIADFNYKDFIYPYAGYYSNIKSNCKDCSFKEVASLEKVAEYMVNYAPRASNGKPNSHNATGTR